MTEHWPFTPEVDTGGWQIEARKYTGEVHYIIEGAEETPDEGEANASLIAAAPRMYRALKTIVQRMDEYRENPSVDELTPIEDGRAVIDWIDGRG